MTRETWHVTCVTWHLTCDTWWGVNILSFLALTVWVYWCFEGLEEKGHSMNELINELQRCCRTAPATPGLLNTHTQKYQEGKEIVLKKCFWNLAKVANLAIFFIPATMSLLHVRSKVCMALFHVRSKVCIAPIHVRSKFVDFAPHMEGSNAYFALHMEGSNTDFAPHMERRHSFRI